MLVAVSLPSDAGFLGEVAASLFSLVGDVAGTWPTSTEILSQK